jgi:putative ABC transport system permease protein
MTLSAIWTEGLLRRRGGRLAGTILGIAVAVALVATLAGFFAATRASMTRQAIADVAADWQVQLAPGSDPRAAIDELGRKPGYTNLAQVGYADTPGFEAATGSTVQTTGPGKVLGLDPNYRAAFPAEIRDLIGQGSVLLAQQTAANLHAGPGSAITVKRPGLDPVPVTVTGVVDLPLADSLFQAIGVPAGSAPQAPPDNVLLLSLDQWHALFDPVAQIAPEAVRMQLHASVPHDLPADPTAAYAQVSSEARNYETRLAGSGIVGDNLAARLDVARSDALYAQMLFLFLGLPGALLAALLTAVVAAAGAMTRRRDQALLRLRGAAPGQVVALAAVEALVVGLGASLLGLTIAALVVRATFGQWGFGIGLGQSAAWAVASALGGIILATLVIVVPAWRDARGTSVATARVAVGRHRAPWWERLGLDVILLAAAGLVFWQQAQGGYELVLAPEGVPRVSVSYTSFLAPLLLWAGAALLAVRLTRLALGHNGQWLAPLLRMSGGRLASLAGAALSRHRGRVATGLVIVMLAVAFAASTAIFNATYEAQSLVDAELTNGADVTVSGGQAADLGHFLEPMLTLPGVVAAEPMQHRFAYVGTDLQDLYGIDPASLTNAARLTDSYFVGATASEAMQRLAATPDGVLVSPETVSDFQLQPGDTIKLRLQSAADHQYHPVPFRFMGVAREFPTAPSDSFLVANATYVARQTGSPAVETLLIRTNRSPAAVANEVRDILGGASGASVHDIEAQRQITRSSLTAVSLRGLTRLELGFSLALAAAGAGVVLALGLAERRRTLAITTALGATPRQLGAFVWSEASVILGGGSLAGFLLGWGVAAMLVKLLTHVFDPPPAAASVPWDYLAAVLAVTSAAVIAAGVAATRAGRCGVLEVIRQL